MSQETWGDRGLRQNVLWDGRSRHGQQSQDLGTGQAGADFRTAAKAWRRRGTGGEGEANEAMEMGDVKVRRNGRGERMGLWMEQLMQGTTYCLPAQSGSGGELSGSRGSSSCHGWGGRARWASRRRREAASQSTRSWGAMVQDDEGARNKRGRCRRHWGSIDVLCCRARKSEERARLSEAHGGWGSGEIDYEEMYDSNRDGTRRMLKEGSGLVVPVITVASAN